MEERFYGILTSIDWNSRKWQDVPTDEDLTHADYDYVKEHGYTNTAINFGHELFTVDESGFYSGLLPQLWSKVPDPTKGKFIQAVFIRSRSWRDHQHYIVGFYAFPVFHKCIIPSPLKLFNRDFEMNVKAYPKDIHLLETYIRIDTDSLIRFLPAGKRMGTQGFNYLTKKNVLNILDEMTKHNPADTRLSGIKLRLIKSIGADI